jgi:hypothetical protein
MKAKQLIIANQAPRQQAVKKTLQKVKGSEAD